MRILQVRFKNLNSLVGEWSIDLAHPAYESDGIFAITGPTGAGKSTILDAICLGLYGRTPRLNKVTKSSNEVMSRLTGECFAEVTFETQTGRFRCHWSQHRARKKPDGELQQPKHEIADAVSGQIFNSKARGVAEQIVSATGMDFHQFSRSMLLAQGDFAAFLLAPPDERSPILEQITGTEIYSQISVGAHERQREERDKLNLLQTATAGIAILEPEQESALEQAIESKRREETDVAAKSAETGKAIAWLTAINGLKQEIIGLADEAGKLRKDIEAFQPERDKLDRALSAATLDGTYAMLTAMRRQQADDQAALKAEEEALPEVEASARGQGELLKSAEYRTAAVKTELKAAAPHIQKVRSLDQQLAEQKKTVAEGEENCRKDAVKIAADQQARLKARATRADAEKILGLVDGELREKAQDEWLISGLAGVEEQLHGLLSRQKEIVQRETDQEKAVTALAQATKARDDCQRQFGYWRRALDAAATSLQQGKDALSVLLGDRLLREYRAEKEALLRELAFLAKIAELEEHRAKLEDGSPCPLCGATEHPFAAGNVPVPDEADRQIATLARLIGKAEEQEAAIKKLEAAEVVARNNLAEGEKRQIVAANDKKAAEIVLAEGKAALQSLRTDFTWRREAVLAKLQPLGIGEIPDADVPLLLESLRARLQAWQTRVRKKTEIEKQLADTDSELKRLDAVITTHGVALAEKRARLEALGKAYVASGAERQELYGDKNPDAEELRLNQAVADAEAVEKQARELHIALQQTLNTAKTRADSLKTRILLREPELARALAEFSAAFKSVDFADEKQFLEARLKVGHRELLAARGKELDDSHTDLKARQKDRETRLAAEIARKVTDKSLEELELQCKDYADSLSELRERIAGLKHRLLENAAAKEQIKARQTVIAAQKRECLRWDKLHELIGSADGKKYRNFAQGLTFEMMVRHANRQLQKMTDRYVLIRDTGQPLELNVIDNYQAGDVRSTKNLSGGESFLVSLSLALGLSHMASRNVRVDSLFLDEGFGTLDEDALDTALETLAGLQQDGKLIGIISHVVALKERIGTQIQVEPQTGGRSVISGPGCKREGKDLVQSLHIISG